MAQSIAAESRENATSVRLSEHIPVLQVARVKLVCQRGSVAQPVLEGGSVVLAPVEPRCLTGRLHEVVVQLGDVSPM